MIINWNVLEDSMLLSLPKARGNISIGNNFQIPFLTVSSSPVVVDSAPASAGVMPDAPSPLEVENVQIIISQ